MLSFFQHTTLSASCDGVVEHFPHEGARCEHDRLRLPEMQVKEVPNKRHVAFLICSTVVLEAESCSALHYDGEISSASTPGRKKEYYSAHASIGKDLKVV
jgi:hypothetical protein